MAIQAELAESREPISRVEAGSYAELRQIIKARGLLDRQPRWALARLLAIDALLVVSVALLLTVHVFWFQLLNALLLAFATAQTGFNGHDAGHRQSFGSTLVNDIVGLIHGNLGVGMSFSWWLDKHNRHHSHPNELDTDPDIDIPMLSFTLEDAASKRGILRFIAAHQAFFFFPLLMLVGLDLQRSSVMWLLAGKARHAKTEALLMLAHVVGYLALVFVALPWWQALAFIAIHQLASGLYLGSVFAPNHKGMLITERSCRLDFLPRQVLTARNVRGNAFIDMWYGGLNYQIEHHLFPTMSRNHLKQARVIIKAYCEEYGLAYHETGMGRSYVEILSFLHEVGAPAREGVAGA
ncbi:MAG TPA: acyl-CoA desaturase [Ktedonobacterales bacterium]